MKRYILLVLLIFSGIGFAQNSINYKAVIRDDNGNLITNQSIVVQFNILQGTITAYQESHSTTTDDNGIIILNIGQGTPSFGGMFEDIEWGSEDHFLKVQIDSGNGFIDMGTTAFNTVPYALNASNVSGLVQITENNGMNDFTGWRLFGRNPNFYGSIGSNAVDLSLSNENSSPYGAISDRSLATGFNTTASGSIATAMGSRTIADGTASTALGFLSKANGFASLSAGEVSEANGYASIAMGSDAIASGDYSLALGDSTLAESSFSIAMGRNTTSNSYNSMAVGRYNLGGGDASTWLSADPLFEIGNGTFSTPSNAVTVLKNGNVGIGTHTPDEKLHITGGRLRIGTETIEDGGNNALRFNARLLPDNNDAFSLGSSSLRWTTVYATNGSINTSDRREKKNIKALNYGLEEVLKMQPVSFNWKNKSNPDTKLGLVAQDLLELIPEVVKTHEWRATSDDQNAPLEKVELDRLGVYYSDLIPVLIKAMQEQQDIIYNQKSAIIQYEKKIVEQSEILESLLSRIDALEEINNQ